MSFVLRTSESAIRDPRLETAWWSWRAISFVTVPVSSIATQSVANRVQNRAMLNKSSHIKGKISLDRKGHPGDQPIRGAVDADENDALDNCDAICSPEDATRFSEADLEKINDQHLHGTWIETSGEELIAMLESLRFPPH